MDYNLDMLKQFSTIIVFLINLLARDEFPFRQSTDSILIVATFQVTHANTFSKCIHQNLDFFLECIVIIKNLYERDILF